MKDSDCGCVHADGKPDAQPTETPELDLAFNPLQEFYPDFWHGIMEPGL